MHLSSFDIFDTLVTRLVARPRDLFWVLGHQLVESGCIEIGADAYQRLRYTCECGLEGHARLPDIYARLAKRLNWNDATRQRAMDCELELESKMIYGIPSMRALVEQQRERGHAIVFISDMYLPPEFLESMLRREGFFEDGDVVFVSGYEGSGKTEQLFDKVKIRYPVVDSWHHWGDNLFADIRPARKRGIVAHYVQPSDFSRCERRVLGRAAMVYPKDTLAMRFLRRMRLVRLPDPYGVELGLERSLLAGAMRKARLEIHSDDPHRIQMLIAANVIGPLFVAYVEWVLEEAKRAELDRLYFVARDGQILLKVARALCKHWGDSIDLRYLYGSRRTFYLARAHADNLEIEKHLHGRFSSFTLRQFLALFHLNEELCLSVLGLEQLDEAEWNQRIGAMPERMLTLTEHPEIRDRIAQFLKTYQANFYTYLCQAGLVDDPHFGFVDIGWSGRSHLNLKNVFKRYGLDQHAQFATYFFGYRPSVEVPTLPKEMRNFWDALEARQPIPIQRLNCTLLELFCQADHGMSIGYTQGADGNIEPVLEKENNPNAIQWGIREFHEKVEQFADVYASVLPNKVLDMRELRMAATDLFCFFQSNPTSAEAAIVNYAGFSEESVETNEVKISPILSTWKIVRYLIFFTRRPTSWWLEGTYARTKSFVLWCYIRMRRLNWRLRQV